MWTSPPPPPIFRGLATLLAFFGIVIAHSVILLGAALLGVLVTLSVQGRLRAFARFAGAVILPVGLGLMIIWGLVRQGTPDDMAEPSIRAGVLYATIVTLRLALLGAVFQAAFLALPTPKLVNLLHSFRIRGRGLAVIVSTLNLWPDFRRHVENIVAARCARGLMPDRRLITRLRQLPLAVRTLFISALGQGLERADSWEASGLIERLNTLGARANGASDCSPIAGAAWLAMAALWVIAATSGWP